MLRFVSGGSRQYCDGIARRTFLQLGALGFGGLTLADLLRAEAAAGIGSSKKALINIHLSGGPSHQDMFDLKPQAPVEYRGEFNPIRTNVSGLEICEHFPQLAQMADRFAVIRSLVGMHNDHSNFHTHSGFGRRDLQNVGGAPALGSVVAKLLGSSTGGAPPFISYNGGEPGFLGPAYRPYTPSGNDLRLNRSMSAERLENRTALLASLDGIRRDMDQTGKMAALDSFTEHAVGVVTSGKVADAIDLGKEDPKTVKRYGGAGGNEGRNFLLARRLIEAGARVITFNWGGWDTHANNFRTLRTQLPKLDVAMSALLSDLHERGMSDDVLIVMWGEFGRTPRVNRSAGRDHWLRLAMAFLAGGGLKMGQAIGASSRYGEDAQDRPVHLQEVFATLYRHFGIDVESATLLDPAGRPQFLAGADHRRPIEELV